MEMKKDVEEIFLTGFAKRHFSGKSSVTQVKGVSSSEFIDNVNLEISPEGAINDVDFELSITDGAFPFSRIIKMTNFTESRTAVMPINLLTAQYLRTDYSARTEGELPVMTRWIELPSMIKAPVARNLSVVLYSRKQLLSELFERPEDDNITRVILRNFVEDLGYDNLIEKLDEFHVLNKKKKECVFDQNYELASEFRTKEREVISELGLDRLSDSMKDQILEMSAPWGVVAIMAHDGENPEPMNPITIMRNALGKEEGGNGTPLDKDAYNKSVEFWRTHANVK